MSNISSNGEISPIASVASFRNAKTVKRLQKKKIDQIKKTRFTSSARKPGPGMMPRTMSKTVIEREPLEINV